MWHLRFLSFVGLALMAHTPSVWAQNPIPLPSVSQLGCAGGPCFKVTNTSTGSGDGIQGVSAVGSGVYGVSTGADGVTGTSSNGVGVRGIAGTQGHGVLGLVFQGDPYAGVRGNSFASNAGLGVLGSAVGDGIGVKGTSVSGHGMFGTTGGSGTGANAVAGVFGTSSAGVGLGVKGKVTGAGTGVWGDAGATGYGVFGQALGGVGYGVYGYNNSTGYGVYGLNTTGGYAGYFNQNIYIVGNTSTGSLTNRSDARLKRGIRDSRYGLREVLAMRPVSYRWKDRAQDEAEQLGLLAQDLQKVVPEVVRADHSNGMLAVNYIGLIPVVIKAVQEQQLLLQKQASLIERQQRQIDALKTGRATTASILDPVQPMATFALGLLPVGLILLGRRRKTNSNEIRTTRSPGSAEEKQTLPR
jgi:hypothetical protein